ncbi:hypothetical protein UCRPC4_g02288 [Phaeomoniella chlamydospora]|uniref:Uncharacterized protein n=1 Tax=Phaeomoniella chlamydospora TaxID=158046 RepID=A0A0G2GMU4_PHACM|nr:hypothetical protein UCRPC4_g02288 [Phaeomoniella chlamydospora]
MENTQDTPSAVPLDSPFRTQAIHPSLPGFKVTSTHPSHQLNPITNTAWTVSELEALGLKTLLAEHPDPESASKAQEEAVKQLKAHVDANENKRKQIEREMQDAERTRELERKIFENMRKEKKGKEEEEEEDNGGEV